jgi:hypothetical protein
MTILFDFDGTITDVEHEAAPYLARFRHRFSKRMGVLPHVLDGMVVAYEARVRTDPKAGWEHGGHIVAPATADPYLTNNAIFTSILKDIFEIKQERRDSIMYELHTDAYAHAGTAFREGAKELLLSLDNVVIITNSKPDAVLQKLAQLDCSHIPIIGNAKKYVIDQSLDEVPESVRPAGFPREVLLRRRHYADALRSIGRIDAVIGDIFELDLALPEHLGYKVIQLETAGTQTHEREYMKGRIAPSLRDIRDLI